MDADSRPTAVEEIYSNDGSEISASTVGVKYGKKLLIGSVTQNALLCELTGL